jgi:hypothetical protein
MVDTYDFSGLRVFIGVLVVQLMDDVWTGQDVFCTLDTDLLV